MSDNPHNGANNNAFKGRGIFCLYTFIMLVNNTRSLKIEDNFLNMQAVYNKTIIHKSIEIIKIVLQMKFVINSDYKL